MDLVQFPVCMTCAPRTNLLAAPDREILSCPACHRATPLKILPMYLIAGASGSGKSSVMPMLRHRLSALGQFIVMDTDSMLHRLPASCNAWHNDWLLLAYTLAQNNQILVLCGHVDPARLASQPARALVGELRVLMLDCDDATRTTRLRKRPPWRGWTQELILEELAFAARMRTAGYEFIDTGRKAVHGTVDTLVALIMASDEQPG